MNTEHAASLCCPYPAYKPSGFPWLGDVPEHWVGINEAVVPYTTEPG